MFRASNEVLVKCGFPLENIQPAPIGGGILIVNISYYWSTDAYRTTYFNDYLFFSLKSDIEKKVIANGQIGSSWQFRRFLFTLILRFKTRTYIYLDSIAAVAEDGSSMASVLLSAYERH